MSSYSYTSSSASLVSHTQQPRDYSAAFGALASSYGASGAAPSRPSSKTASHLSSSSSSPSFSSKRLRSLFSRRPTSSTPTPQYSEKHVVPKSQDLGALMDQYGAAGVGSAHGVL